MNSFIIIIKKLIDNINEKQSFQNWFEFCKKEEEEDVKMIIDDDDIDNDDIPKIYKLLNRLKNGKNLYHRELTTIQNNNLSNVVFLCNRTKCGFLFLILKKYEKRNRIN